LLLEIRITIQGVVFKNTFSNNLKLMEMADSLQALHRYCWTISVFQRTGMQLQSLGYLISPPIVFVPTVVTLILQLENPHLVDTHL
jgi:hypothetical protein